MLLASLALLGAVTFVNPQEGSQAVGGQWIEVKTDRANVDRVEFSIDGVLAGVARTAPWRIAHDFGTSLDSHKITAKVFSNGYRTTETATIHTASLTAGEVMNVDLVEVPMRVRAPFVVKAADLALKENGVTQEVRDVRAERGPAHFFFVVDRSLSMGDGKLAAALEAIDKELVLLRPGDTASVVLFNHNVSRARAIAKGEQVASLFRDVEPSGGTSLYDALASIVTRDRTYAFVITDGGDRDSVLSAEEALRRVSNTRTVVEAIVLGSHTGFLQDAAKNTGGEVVRASAATLDGALRDLINDINSRYLLIYQSHGTKRGWRTINITPRKREVAVLKARKGYYAE